MPLIPLSKHRSPKIRPMTRAPRAKLLRSMATSSNASTLRMPNPILAPKANQPAAKLSLNASDKAVFAGPFIIHRQTCRRSKKEQSPAIRRNESSDNDWPHTLLGASAQGDAEPASRRRKTEPPRHAVYSRDYVQAVARKHCLFTKSWSQGRAAASPWLPNRNTHSGMSRP